MMRRTSRTMRPKKSPEICTSDRDERRILRVEKEKLRLKNVMTLLFEDGIINRLFLISLFFVKPIFGNF